MISAIVTTRNEGELLHRTVAQCLDTLPAESEVVVVDDGSRDGSLPLPRRLTRHARVVRSRGLGVARARNLGAARSRGGLLVFMDAHMDLPAGWWEPLARTLARPNVGAVSPAIRDLHDHGAIGYGERFQSADLTLEWLPRRSNRPYPVPVLCGCFWMMRRATFDRCGGFDAGMIGWGSEDCELSLRLWLMGYEAWLVPDVIVGHLFREAPPYRIDWVPLIHNRLRVATAHFGRERLIRVAEALRKHDALPDAARLAMRPDGRARRRRFMGTRVRTDDWYFAFSGRNV